MLLGVDLVRIPPASLVADVIPKVSYYSHLCKNIRNLNVIKTFSIYIFDYGPHIMKMRLTLFGRDVCCSCNNLRFMQLDLVMALKAKTT